jgi:hypothetical protein
MHTVFVAGLAVSLPTRFEEGSTLDETEAAFLTNIQHRRVSARLRWLLARGEVDQFSIQEKADELCRAELVPWRTTDDSEEEDPILAEAMNIARELINSRMAQEGLPPPKGLDIHAKQLVDAIPEIQEQARLRVEARYRAGTVNGASE